MKNNLNANTVTTLLIVLLVLLIIGFFIPKSFLNTSSSKKDFANFKVREKGGSSNATPNQLKWKKSFVYEKEKEKQQGSYIQYLFNKKNKDKK
jgi:hypothetical protein